MMRTTTIIAIWLALGWAALPSGANGLSEMFPLSECGSPDMVRTRDTILAAAGLMEAFPSLPQPPGEFFATLWKSIQAPDDSIRPEGMPVEEFQLFFSRIAETTLKNSIRTIQRAFPEKREHLWLDTRNGETFSVPPAPDWPILRDSLVEIRDCSAELGIDLRFHGHPHIHARRITPAVTELLVAVRPVDGTAALIFPAGSEPAGNSGAFGISGTLSLVFNYRYAMPVNRDRGENGERVFIQGPTGEAVVQWGLFLVNGPVEAAEVLADRLNLEPVLLVDLREDDVRVSPAFYRSAIREEGVVPLIPFVRP